MFQDADTTNAVLLAQLARSVSMVSALQRVIGIHLFGMAAGSLAHKHEGCKLHEPA